MMGLVDYSVETDDDVFPLSRSKMETVLTKYDAAAIFNDRYLGGEKGIPHTNFMPYWNRDLGKVKVSTYYYGAPKVTLDVYRSKPKGWSNDRYKKAMNKIDTYLVDWDWTVAQHRIGAKFAAQRCRPFKFGDNVDDLACKVYEDPLSKCDEPQIPANKLLGRFVGGLDAIVDGLYIKN